MVTEVHSLCGEPAMVALGKQLAAELAVRVRQAGGQPVLVFLRGDLGAGKSVLVRAVVHALGFTGAVKSPTYTLVEHYVFAAWRIAHLDLYRLTDPEELHYIGYRDLLGSTQLLLIEWPDQADGELGTPDCEIDIEYGAGTEERQVRLRWHPAA